MTAFRGAKRDLSIALVRAWAVRDAVAGPTAALTTVVATLFHLKSYRPRLPFVPVGVPRDTKYLRNQDELSHAFSERVV